MTTLEILRGMRELLADEKRWTKGVFARDADGMATCPVYGEASCFCIAGAARMITNDRAYGTGLNAWRARVLEAARARSLGEWNDAPERTHAEVLAALDKAIELESAR